VDWLKQMRLYNIICLKAGMSCYRNLKQMDAKRFCLLTILSLAVILIIVVNIVWLKKERIWFIEEVGKKKNITTVYNLISSSKNTSQQHLDKHITKTGKTFPFAPMTCNNDQ